MRGQSHSARSKAVGGGRGVVLLKVGNEGKREQLGGRYRQGTVSFWRRKA